jgi:predicted Zn-dependent protease
MVDPQSLLLTGLTRDGTFYVENGKIKYPVKNFRFNESPVTMLNNVDELGKPVSSARRRGALPDGDAADEGPRLQLHLAVRRGVRWRHTTSTSRA